MSKLMDKMLNSKLSRRQFLKGSAMATAAVAGLSMTACAEESTLTTTSGESDWSTEALETVAPIEHSPIVDLEEGGVWKNAACWHNCGGRCVNKVYVKDGVVLRQKTDDTHEDTPDYPQQRACPRGHSQRMQVFAADRLKYPMKRKNWEPHTGGKKELRGIDEWEQITWEEALDYVAEELRYAKETYGNSSILYPSWAMYWGFMAKLMGMSYLGGYGGYTEVADTASFGSFSYNVQVMGIPMLSSQAALDRISLRKCDYIVLQGCNPAWSSAGNPAYHLQQAKKAGAQYIFIGPEYNVTASMLDAKWIRIRPGSDTCFMLAVAYEMLKLDEEKGDIIDWDMLNRCSVGFDAEHMPADAVSNENFKDYLLGAYDNLPKTAEWASEICGAPAEDIRWYAETIGKKNNVALLHSFAPARCNNAEDFPQLYYTLGMMGGHWGKEGNCTGNCYHAQCANNTTNMVASGMGGQAQQIFIPNEMNMDTMRGPELWKGILEGKHRYSGNYLMGMGADAPGEDREVDIHVIIHESHNFLQTQVDINSGIKVHRKMDFVMSMSSFYNASAKYSDIILPVTTMWEREDAVAFCGLSTNGEMRVIPEKIVDPLYDCKDDIWIVKELATRLGLNGDALFPHSDAQAKYNYVSSITHVNPDGSMIPVATITQSDLDEMGVQGAPQEGLMPVQELLEKGVYQVPRSEGDGYAFIPYSAFVADPENNPLPSASGKLEIYCQAKADLINAMGRSTVKPYPSYIAPKRGYEESFSDWAGKVKGEYPYQIINPHYLRRAHTALDNVSWLRETWVNPVWLNPQDAADKGVKEGDTVLLYNEYGKTLRHAALTERLMPGVIALPHGAWVDIDEKTGIDRGGSDNILCAPVSTGIGTSGYNTNLVNFEKYDGEALVPDTERNPGAINL